jgi:general secretion pathway protein I
MMASPSMMASLRVRSCRRAGFSILEVLVALAIFLFSLVAIGRLVTLGADQAFEVRLRSQAVEICQSKIAEVAAGAIPLQSQSDAPLDEDPDWHWSLDCEQNTAANLWNVTVKVNRQTAGGNKVEVTMQEMVLDPSVRGSAFDAWYAASTAAANNTSSNTNSSSSNSSSGNSPSGSGAAGGAMGGAAGKSGGTPGTSSPSMGAPSSGPSTPARNTGASPAPTNGGSSRGGGR